jgi:hypothetical protein
MEVSEKKWQQVCTMYVAKVYADKNISPTALGFPQRQAA